MSFAAALAATAAARRVAQRADVVDHFHSLTLSSPALSLSHSHWPARAFSSKTTTISMLNGMIPISSGKASMYGRDVERDSAEIRTFMGMCPQHDVLWPDLTVYEHLEFFGKLKGIRLGELHGAVMAAIDEVQLRPKMTTASASLSGGQRRRLSLAIALIGDSKVVFLSVRGGFSRGPLRTDTQTAAAAPEASSRSRCSQCVSLNPSFHVCASVATSLRAAWIPSVVAPSGTC